MGVLLSRLVTAGPRAAVCSDHKYEVSRPSHVCRHCLRCLKACACHFRLDCGHSVSICPRVTSIIKRSCVILSYANDNLVYQHIVRQRGTDAEPLVSTGSHTESSTARIGKDFVRVNSHYRDVARAEIVKLFAISVLVF